MKRIIALIICTAMLTVTLVGCGSTLVGDDKGAIVDMYLSTELYNFDPALHYTDDAMIKFFSLIYQGITSLNKDGGWEKALMKDYVEHYDSDKGEYYITIDLNSTKWNDGRTVQAQDFVFAWKRLIDPEFYSDAAVMLYDIKNGRECKSGNVSVDDFGVTALDTYVLKIEFNYAVDLDAFFATCASPALVPLREDAVSHNVNWAKKTSSIKTNGPFAVKEIDHKVLVRLERSAYYYINKDKDEALDKYVIPWRIITHYSNGDLEAQLAKYDAGDIYYLGDIPLTSRKDRQNDAIISDIMSTHTYYFNLNNELFQKAEVRQALSMALDRNAIVDIVTYAKAATGLIPYKVLNNGKGTSFRDEGENLITTTGDVDGAKALLKEAGVKKGSFTITVKDNEVDLAIAKYVLSVWEDLGFDVTLNVGKNKVADSKIDQLIYTDTYTEALEAGEYDVIAIDMQMLNSDAFSALAVFANTFSGGGVDMQDKTYPYISHYTGYNSDEYNALIEQVYAEHDSEKRATLLHQAEQMLINDIPACPLVFLQSAYLVNKKLLSGIKETYFGTTDFSRMKMKDYMTYKDKSLAAETAE